MNDEQRRVALFQAQPEGLGLFFRPAALAFAHVESLHIAHAALLDEKIVPAGPIGLVLTGPNAEQRMLEKLRRSLTDDIAPLLAVGIRFDDDAAMVAFNQVWRELITQIKGDSWKLSGQVIDELQNGKMPNLLR